MNNIIDISKYDKTLKELEYISKSAGLPIEYTQGGGGNTSVKLDEELMAVKASGFKLKQITPSEGYVVVSHKNICGYLDSIVRGAHKPGEDSEKEGNQFVKDNVLDTGSEKKLRPSVEAGFHSVLRRFVIHTHPVYANILCCSKEGREKVEEIFGGRGVKTAWIPYINPGFSLSLIICSIVKEGRKLNGDSPNVIFMENHGLIVTDDDSKTCASLHEEVNNAIREGLGIREDYPAIELFSVDEFTHISRTGFLTAFFKDSGITADFFDRNILYPDQLVYLNGSISVGSVSNKLNITASGEIIYKCSLEEAHVMEESMLAYVYVLEGIRKAGLTLKTMSESGSDFIRNWESEAYRRGLVK